MCEKRVDLQKKSMPNTYLQINCFQGHLWIVYVQIQICIRKKKKRKKHMKAVATTQRMIWIIKTSKLKNPEHAIISMVPIAPGPKNITDARGDHFINMFFFFFIFHVECNIQKPSIFDSGWCFSIPPPVIFRVCAPTFPIHTHTHTQACIIILWQ